MQTLVVKGHDVINLGQGNPDLPTPKFIVKALQEASENPKFHKYPPFQGYSFLKEAVAEFYLREYGVNLDPNKEVAILFGAKTGLVEISQCLLNPGDRVLVPDPGYPDYMSGIAIANAQAVYMPLLKENDFLPDYGLMDKEDLDRAKLMFLNYPNNPTAATATLEFFLKKLSQLPKSIIFVSSMILLMEQSALRIGSHQASYRQKGQRILGWKCIPSRKPLIWLAGESALL